MMKTTKNKIVVLIVFLLAHLSIHAQYNGGSADGSSSETLSMTSCPTPNHFYAYFGGEQDGSGSETISTTTCGFSNHFYAYFGGIGDGSATEETSLTACGVPNHFYAYFGGENDGAGLETVNGTTCDFPAQFYAYFGGIGDGHSFGGTAPVCPTQPPVASFTASATTICVGQSVTFTDTSTNIPGAWIWTFPGGTPNTSTVQNPTVVYNTAGNYTVTLQAFNFNGNNTATVTNYISVIAVPTVTSTTPASRCDAGTVTLQASASAGTLNWYDAPTLGNLVGTGTSFTTPSISATTTYYVQTAVGSCTSARTAVIATVNTTPTLASTTPASRCGMGNLTLQATAATGTIRWYDFPTAGTLLATGATLNLVGLATTTTYYVEVTNGLCTSVRTPVIATINPMPTIISTTAASRCDTGTVTLLAAASGGTVNWYDAPTAGSLVGTGTSFTTPSISVSTTYYVETTNGTCPSPRTAVIATVNATPTITSTTPGSRCDAGTVTLQAATTAGTLNWYALPSGGAVIGTGGTFITPSIAATTTYYVEAINGSCTSVRTSVIATVNTSPTITTTTPASICSGDSFTISATASAGTLSWYNLPTGGTLLGSGSNYSLASLGATSTFYVQATNGSCSSARTAVEVTVTNRPTNTSSTPGSRCGNGTVVLAATFSSGTVNWYDAPLLGNLVGTGSTFVTPSLSITTTYYAEATNGSCTSLVRTAVTATVNVTPSITSTTPASRCGTGTVTLNAVASSGTLSWYDAPTAGILLGTGTSFTTPSIAITTIFYVSAANGTCTSSRTAVTATVNTLPTLTSTTGASRCDTGTVTLQAAASTGTLSWYDAPTAGNLVGTGTSFTTPAISITTIYYVEVANGTCTSARTAVTATVNATPSITSTTPGNRCDTGSVTLQAAASSGTLSWYDAPTLGNLVGTGGTFITPSITATTTYYVSAANGSCTSVRTPVIATVNSSPSVTATTPASICSGDSFTISAVASSGTLSWYNLPSGGTLLATGSNYSLGSLSTTTTFYVQATNGGCSSARTAVEVTVTNRPSNTSSTPGSRCGNGTVVLAATFSSGTVNWYDAPLLGNLVGTGTTFVTPVLSLTTTYYAEATNGSCTTLIRTAVTATVNEIPVVLSTTPASRCGTGTVTLQATASVGTLNWYNAPTGGSFMGTGSSFTTPVIAATTPYYVEVVNGTCSSARTMVTATVHTVATVTSTTPATRCDAGTLTLSAAANIGTLNWYNAPSAGTLVGTGTSFTTPSISVTTVYYVEATNGTCISARVAVTATITPTTAPTAAATQSFCTGATVASLAVTGSNIIWYDAATNGTVVPSATVLVNGSVYYASQTIGGCESPTRTGVAVTINAVPTIVTTIPGSRCGDGTVTLQATASAGTVRWYDAAIGGNLLATGPSFTTPVIAVTTLYYAEVVNGSCTSATRTLVTATVHTVATITSSTSANRCNAGTLTLTAVANIGTLNWYDAPVAGNLVGTGNSFTTPTISVTTIYYVEATNGTCTSARVAVTATIAPTAPPIAASIQSFCNGATVASLAVTGSNVIWYDAATNGNSVPSVTALVNGSVYYASQTISGCESPVRTGVTVTVNAIPTIVSTIPGSRCGDGTVTLQATASAGTINWYDAPTGGVLLATGASYTTPVLGTTTFYYVEVTDGACISTRTQVTATVFAVAAVTSTVPASRCDAGTLTLSATSNIGTLNWYNLPTGGTLLGTGASFTTPSISVSATYYVEATNGSCTSARVAVLASISQTAAPTAAANQTFCAGETVGSIAVTGTNIVWYDAPTNGNVIPTGTPIVSGTTYYASQTVGLCESTTRTAVVMTLGPCLGNDEFIANVIKVYPNPVTDILHIASTEPMTRIEMVNMLGQMVFSNKLNEMETTVDMERYSAGTYIIMVSVDDKFETFKIIKR